jgi:choline dehydrogenase
MKEFDYVVVGAGSAGCVLAARLSEDPTSSVALLEAGGSDRSLAVRAPAAFNKLFRSERDWAYETEPEVELGGRRLFWPRGKCLGGSSSMNAMIYIRGHPADYDAWAAAGCPGWSWSEVLPSFRRSEHQQRGGSDSHGEGGPLWVSDLRDPCPQSLAFVEAAREIGIPANEDFNGPRQEGAGLYQVTQRAGRRHSTASAFLGPARGRGNLEVITRAQAQRVLFDGDRARGVAYLRKGEVREVLARQEVLLAAGAVSSPQLLALSGIGPADALRALGLAVIADRPEVGKNLQDHLAVPISWHCLQGGTLDSAETIGNLLRWLFRGRGPFTSNVGEGGAFIRTRPELDRPDIQLIMAPAFFVDHGMTRPGGAGVSIGPVLLRPTSRGEIALASADPRAAPRISARYLSAAEDRAPLREGLRVARRIAAAKAFAGVCGRIWDEGLTSDEDAVLDAHIRVRAQTLYHPVGTCRMGSDEGAVVDPELRVKGVGGLRVVDASIMPTIVGGNTNAPVIMIAERAAELVRGAAKG